ncbi:urease accessory protein UreF [Hansschlegelia plantiphila]|uniref:Urease accessory protein UreF n=2 Tax=Hansschlegelia plantiphila TaxID=374655 RepID=A0A9W6MU11_9HYPH|nr:urease accessory protein UreF [Hansschlegelia plantiphila]
MTTMRLMAKRPTATDKARAAFRPQGNGGDQLLALLQLTNASFPTGAFTHSFGFETWIDAQVVADAAEAERRSRDWLRYAIATGDAVAVALSYRAALDGDVDALVALDAQVGALKLSRETRSASVMTGKALLAACRDIFELEGTRRFEAIVADGACEGHHAVLYGIAGAGLALGEAETVTSYLWSSIANLVAVTQRLVPLGQVDAQRIVKAAGPLIDECSAIARSRPAERMCSACAALDAAAMRHERLPTRLCIS